MIVWPMLRCRLGSVTCLKRGLKRGDNVTCVPVITKWKVYEVKSYDTNFID